LHASALLAVFGLADKVNVATAAKGERNGKFDGRTSNGRKGGSQSTMRVSLSRGGNIAPNENIPLENEESVLSHGKQHGGRGGRTAAEIRVGEIDVRKASAIDACREVQLKETNGNYTFTLTEEIASDAPVYSTKLVHDPGRLLFLFFDSKRGSWTAAFNVSDDAQGYYSSTALISNEWNVFSNGLWISGGDHVATACVRMWRGPGLSFRFRLHGNLS
jgi:hypothetical protein